MRARRLAIVLLFGAIGLGASACGERAEPTGVIAPSYPVTVRGAGDTPTRVSDEPRRVVALDAGSAQLIDALGAGDRLVGVPAGLRRKGTGKTGEVVKKTGQIDVEAIDRLRPDLIVATPDTDPVAVSQAQRQTGAALYLQPSRSVEDVERASVELGFLLGKPAEARRLTASIKEDVARIDERLAAVKPDSVFVDTGFMITASGRSLLGGLVKRARGINIAKNYDGLGPFPVARLKRSDPDVYLATSDSGITLAKLRKNPDTRRLAAVRDGRVAIVPAALVTEAGPRVAQALEAVASALHPNAFR